MARDTTPSNTLPIGQVFKSSGTLVYKYILLWLVLAIALHFVSWKFLIEMGESLKDYIEHMFGPVKFKDNIEHIFGPQLVMNFKKFLNTILENLSEFWEEEVTLRNLVDSVKNYVIALGQLTLLQVIASQLIYDQLVCEKKETGIGSILQRIKTTDFFFDVLRTIGITTIYYGIYFVWFILYFILVAIVFLAVFYLEVLQNSLGLTILLVMVIYIIFLLCLLFIMSRLFLAVPLTVVENKNILESLKRSWRITASCWIRMPIVVVLTWVLTFAIFGLPISVLLESDSSALLERVVDWIYVIFASLLSAIVMAVCYCYLRSAEDRVGLTRFGGVFKA